jgi:phosphate-selective porin OprO/OprP
MRHVFLKATTAITLILTTSPAFALDDAAVLKQLKAMQAELASLRSEVKILKTKLSDAQEQASAAKSQATTVQKSVAELQVKPPAARFIDSDVKVTMTPAPKFETADGANSFKIGGFAQLDAGMFGDDRRDHPDGTNVRRARLSVSGTIAHDFKYKLENDFAGNSSNITDAFVEYVGIEPFSIMVGQFKEPFGLEVLTSDLFTTFMERSSILAFAPDRNIGLAVGANGKMEAGNWTATVGGFGAGTGTASNDDEARDLTGRLTFAPIAEPDKVLHFGVAGSHRIPDSATNSVRIQSRAENRLSSAQAVDTGTIAGVDSTNLMGLEAAAVWGPASLQGEYVTADLNRRAGLSDGKLNGYYVEASYFLTGESRNYSATTARFDRVKPKTPFNLKDGTWGAWQVAARYSDLDLNDKIIRGGELKDTTLAVKWIPNSNVMMTANYIRANTDNAAVTPNDDFDVWMLRTQFDF